MYLSYRSCISVYKYTKILTVVYYLSMHKAHHIHKTHLLFNEVTHVFEYFFYSFYFFVSQHILYIIRMEMMNWYFNLSCYSVMEFDEVENPLQWEHVNTLQWERVIEISSIVHWNSFSSKGQGIDFTITLQYDILNRIQDQNYVIRKVFYQRKSITFLALNNKILLLLHSKIENFHLLGWSIMYMRVVEYSSHMLKSCTTYCQHLNVRMFNIWTTKNYIFGLKFKHKLFFCNFSRYSRCIRTYIYAKCP